MFEELHKRMNSFWNNDRTLSQTDPEFIEFFSNFAYDEVVNEPGANHPDLDDKTRSLAILAVLVGCQGLDAFEMMLPVAYETGLSSIAIKEMVYQATAYCGFGKTLPFLKKLNNFLGAANVHLPLEPQGTTTPETRARAGVGNEKAFLIAVISQCMPYIGYPRTLNAIRCINDAAEQMQG